LHGRFSEFFGPNHGHKQIDEKQKRDESDDSRFHFLKFFAKAHVQRAGEKKCNDDPSKKNVTHIGLIVQPMQRQR